MGKKRETAVCVCPGLFFLRGIKLWDSILDRVEKELTSEPWTTIILERRAWVLSRRMSFLLDCFLPREEKWNVRAIIGTVDSLGKAGCGQNPSYWMRRAGPWHLLSLWGEPSNTMVWRVRRIPEKGRGNAPMSLACFVGVFGTHIHCFFDPSSALPLDEKGCLWTSVLIFEECPPSPSPQF